MHATVLPDGVYRPEKWLNGKWQAVAYELEWAGNRKQLIRTIHHQPTKSGRMFAARFNSLEEAQAQCNELNK